MAHSTIVQDILNQLEQLPDDLQRRVLSFAQALVPTSPKGTPGKELLRFAGSLEETDAQAMARVIEEGCERVDADAW